MLSGMLRCPSQRDSHLVERVAATEQYLRIGYWGKRLFGLYAFAAAVYFLMGV